MLKVSSISSRSSHHSSHQHLSMLVGSESGMLLEAMENETIINSEPGTTSQTAASMSHPRPSSEDPSHEAEPPQKRIKLESISNPIGNSEASTSERTAEAKSAPPAATTNPGEPPSQPPVSTHGKPAVGGGSIVTNSSNSSSSSSSNSSLQEGPAKASQAASGPNPTLSPLLNPLSQPSETDGANPKKATKMSHLGSKYLGELEYMLREFRKLERQLLGAKGAAQLEESAGSRERREKLHSFILHLEDTVRQIEAGCALEAQAANDQGTPTSGSLKDAATKAKEDEDSVQRLEEHVLANLLPVKIRLKKQLAAQQGASKNPPGMPVPRRGSLQPSASAMGKGTFAAAAEERRKQAEAARLAAQEQHEHAIRRVSDPTQFGKPLGGGGSSLTQKLHGSTLGSRERKHGHGVGSSSSPEPLPEEAPTPERKILYAGMVPQSTQHQSGVSAASGAHELVIQDPHFQPVEQQESPEYDVHPSIAPAARSTITEAPTKPATKSSTPSRYAASASASAALRQLEKSKKPHEDESLSDEERRKLRKKRRKRKLKRIARRRDKERQRQYALQQTQAAQGTTKSSGGRKKAALSKGQGKKKGPRAVEYICALCSEAYSSTCDYNPWWALAQHECPKCRKTQVPRIDISSPSNTIEYHPALLAHADDGGNGGSSGAASAAAAAPPAPPAPFKPSGHVKDHLLSGIRDSDTESDLSELSDGSLSDESIDSDDSELLSMSPAERAEHETFGHEYKGPVLSDDHTSRLLVLMAHASTCPCKHKLTKHRDVCRSVKFMMLHVRDCPGTTSSFDVCPFPWCRKVKHVLYHLVSCTNSAECSVCSPKNLSSSLQGLIGLNEFRMKKHRQRLIAASKAMFSTKSRQAALAHARATSKPGMKKTSDATRIAKSRAHYQTAVAYAKSSAQPKAPPTTAKGARPSQGSTAKAAKDHTAPGSKVAFKPAAATTQPPARVAITPANTGAKGPVSIVARPATSSAVTPLPTVRVAGSDQPNVPPPPVSSTNPSAIAAPPCVQTAAMLASHQREAAALKSAESGIPIQPVVPVVTTPGLPAKPTPSKEATSSASTPQKSNVQVSAPATTQVAAPNSVPVAPQANPTALVVHEVPAVQSSSSEQPASLTTSPVGEQATEAIYVSASAGSAGTEETGSSNFESIGQEAPVKEENQTTPANETKPPSCTTSVRDATDASQPAVKTETPATSEQKVDFPEASVHDAIAPAQPALQAQLNVVDAPPTDSTPDESSSGDMPATSATSAGPENAAGDSGEPTESTKSSAVTCETASVVESTIPKQEADKSTNASSPAVTRSAAVNEVNGVVTTNHESVRNAEQGGPKLASSNVTRTSDSTMDPDATSTPKNPQAATAVALETTKETGPQDPACDQEKEMGKGPLTVKA